MCEQVNRVWQCSDAGDSLFSIILGPAQHVRDSKYHPVERQYGRAGRELRERMPMAMHRLDDWSQPQEMIQVAGQDSEDLQLEPLHATGDDYQAGREDHSCRKAVYADVADSDSQKRQQERQSGHDLRPVTQGVPNHGRRDQQHEHQVDALRRKHMSRRDMIRSIGDEEQQRPSAADRRPSENAMAITSLNPEAPN